MRHLLLAKGLWKYVNGTEVLAEDANEATREDFRKKSQKAFSTIVMAVSTPKLYLVTSCDQPKDAWDTLRNYFERETLANKLFLKKKYFRTEMMEGTSLEAHLKHMKEITDQLAAIGSPISEDQVVTLLGSLPPSYSTLVTALEARTDDLKFDFVQQALVHEEQKLNEQSRDISSGDSALVGTYRKGKPSGSRKSLGCFECGELDHYRRNCPKLKKGSAGSMHRAKTAEEDHSGSESDDSEVFPASTDSVDHQMDRWLVDSGASSHMTREKKLLTEYREFETPQKVGLGDGSTVEAVGVGSIRLDMLFRVSESKQAVLYDVLYVPKLSCNLFSIRAAASKGSIVKFGRSSCWIRNRNGELCGMGSLVGKLYQLDCKPTLIEQTSAASEQNDVSLDLWHQRLDHLGEQRSNEMVRKEMASGITVPKTVKQSFCEGCVEGKMNRKPFKPVGEIRSTRKLQLVHSDVCGPMNTDSIGGRRYFVTFIDDYSRCCKVYFMKRKSEVLEKFKEFEAGVTNESGKKIGTLRTDNGGEYVSNAFTNYLKSKGIHHELTIAHTPEQNGVAERMNRTLLESARAMIAHAELPNHYWAEAVAAAAYVCNRTTTTAIKENKTPYERWYGRKPRVSHLKVFGCVAYAHVPDSERRKLDKKAVKLRFVGYSRKSKGYRLFNEQTQKLLNRIDVIFNETEFKLTREDDRKETLEVNEGTTTVDVNEHDSGNERRRSERQKRAPVRYGFNEYADTAKVEHLAWHATCVRYLNHEPLRKL
jgi:hypothetical protein